MSAISPTRSARSRAGITRSTRPSRRSAANGSALPWCVGGGLVAYRKSWLAEAGFPTKFPENWDEYRAAGKKLKAAGRPYGQTAGHTFGDAPGWWYPYLWSWGGKEVEADGKTVVLNSKETIESVKFAVPLWKETMDEGGLAWDDTNNNRAFLSGSISATNNGASIYIEAKKKPDSYLTENGKPMKDDILHAGIPGRPRRSVQPARPVHRHADELFEEPEAGQGLHALDPLEAGVRRMVHLAAGLYRRSHQGLGGPSGVERSIRCWRRSRRSRSPGASPAMPARRRSKAAEVTTKYIIVDMYAKAIQGMPAEDAVKAAHDELVKIYA